MSHVVAILVRIEHAVIALVFIIK